MYTATVAWWRTGRWLATREVATSTPGHSSVCLPWASCLHTCLSSSIGYQSRGSDVLRLGRQP